MGSIYSFFEPRVSSASASCNPDGTLTVHTRGISSAAAASTSSDKKYFQAAHMASGASGTQWSYQSSDPKHVGAWNDKTPYAAHERTFPKDKAEGFEQTEKEIAPDTVPVSLTSSVISWLFSKFYSEKKEAADDLKTEPIARPQL